MNPKSISAPSGMEGLWPVLPLEINWTFHMPAIDAPSPPPADARAWSDFGTMLVSLACANSGPVKFKSPQPANALETNIVTKIPAPTVMVIAREIVFINFLFL
jgi:hypothetical protein